MNEESLIAELSSNDNDARFMAARDICKLFSAQASSFTNNGKMLMVNAFINQFEDTLEYIRSNASTSLGLILEVHDRPLTSMLISSTPLCTQRLDYACEGISVFIARASIPSLALVMPIASTLSTSMECTIENKTKLVDTLLDALCSRIISSESVTDMSESVSILMSTINRTRECLIHLSEHRLAGIVSCMEQVARSHSVPISVRRALQTSKGSIIGRFCSDALIKSAIASLLTNDAKDESVMFIHGMMKSSSLCRLRPFMGEFVLPAVVSPLSHKFARGDQCDCDLVVMALECLGAVVQMKRRDGQMIVRNICNFLPIIKQSVEFNLDFRGDLSSLFDGENIRDDQDSDYEDDYDPSMSWRVRESGGVVVDNLLAQKALPVEEERSFINFILNRIVHERHPSVLLALLKGLSNSRMSGGFSDMEKDALRNLIVRWTAVPAVTELIQSIILRPPLNEERSDDETDRCTCQSPRYLKLLECIDGLQQATDVESKYIVLQSIVWVIGQEGCTCPAHSEAFSHLLRVVADDILVVVPEQVTYIDLGAFKHKHDEGAPLRRLSMLAAASIVETCAPTVAQAAIGVCEKALAMDISDSGHELYPLIGKILSVLRDKCWTLLIDDAYCVLFRMCFLTAHIVASCPKSLPANESPRQAGIALADWILVLRETLEMAATDEGYQLDTFLENIRPFGECLLELEKNRLIGGNSILAACGEHMNCLASVATVYERK